MISGVNTTGRSSSTKYFSLIAQSCTIELPGVGTSTDLRTRPSAPTTTTWIAFADGE